jgi:two-component system, OmpR family, sensor histidine kinase CiaH
MTKKLKEKIYRWFEGLTPFELARLKLTGYYMLIFSVILVMFTWLVFEAKESAFVRVYTVVNDAEGGGPRTVELQDTFADFNKRFQQRVLLFDLGLWVIAAWLAYGLSGKTLKPIRDMWREQEAFVADVSHGLRTPLATMNMEIEAFIRTQKRIPTTSKALLFSLQEEISYLTRITQGVLSLTRARPGSRNHEPVPLTEMATKTTLSFSGLAQAKQQTVRLGKMEEVMVKGNPDQLKQVLTILIDNAIKYGKAGVKVSVSVTKGVSAAKLEVADTGPGIEAKELRTIFRRFYRGEKTKSLARGAGLGLAVAKKIVEAHEGHIRVKSEVGKGTTFTVTLPLLGSS